MSAPRIHQVNVSPGGVPKLPVEEAWVGRLGLEGDGHNDRTLHGGPHRAICLFGLEAIERIQADGHPIEPGGAGENLTTLGVEWSLLPLGTRARIGRQVVIELADSTTPCATTKRNFTGGRFSRMSIDLHPSDSRMYARVLEEGPVRPGDPIEILPPAADTRAAIELSLGRLDRAMSLASLVGWRAAREAGLDIRVEEDGELAMAAAPGISRPAFNKALGLARLPNMVGIATDFFDRHGAVGWLVAEEPLWPGSTSELELAVHAGSPAEIEGPGMPSGFTIRQVGAGDAGAVADVLARANAFGSGGREGLEHVWEEVLGRLAEHPHGAVLLVERSGLPVAAGALFVHHATGWMRAAAVVPEARGLGLQRGLIAARARLAGERGCNLVGAEAVVGSVSARNLERVGLRWIGTRREFRYVPATAEAARGAEAASGAEAGAAAG